MWERLTRYLKRKFILENSAEQREETIEQISRGIDITGNYLWVLVLAIFIASLGLNTNSTAVIIGAMLVSPLMGPIVGLGLGLAINDNQIVQRAIRNLALAVGLSIVTSVLYFMLSPIKQAGSEILARTQPTIYDVLIAIAGGLAGIVAGSGSLRTGNVVPGVAIATALMPPLCTVGYGIANAQPMIASGAFYLFFINSVFICLSTYVIVKLLRYPTKAASTTHRGVAWGIWIAIMAALIPSVLITVRLIKKSVFEERVERFIAKEVQDDSHWVVSKNVHFQEQKIELIVLSKDNTEQWEDHLNQRLSDYKLKGARVSVARNFNTGVDLRSQSLERLYKVDVNHQAIGMLEARVEDMEHAAVKRQQASMPRWVDSLRLLFGNRLKSIQVQPTYVIQNLDGRIDTSWKLTPVFSPPLNKKEKKEWSKRGQSSSTTIVW